MAHAHACFAGAEAPLGTEVLYVDEARAAVTTTVGELDVDRVAWVVSSDRV